MEFDRNIPSFRRSCHTKALKLLVAACAAVAMTHAAMAEKTARVVVEDGGTTLRFVYDDAKPSGTQGTNWFSVAEAEAQSPSVAQPWYGCRSDVTKVVFDSSFANYRPAHCGSWFSYYSHLETIDGLANLDTSAAASFIHMFYYCSSLNTIIVSDSFVTTKVTNWRNMFYGCTALKGWTGSNGKRYDDRVLVFNAAAEGATLTLTAIWE